MRYLLLDLVFLLPVAIAAFLLRARIAWRAVWVACALIFVMTALFDSVIIIADIVRYHPEMISGIRIWRAPIEDFAYALAACLGVAVLWEGLGEKQ